jgi:RHS repeat-associated protein
MIRSYRSPLVLILLALALIFEGLVATSVSAQVVQGTPPFSSLGGSPADIINLFNLNSHITIPVLHKPGRGLPFDFNLTYDSSIWYPTSSSGSGSWQATPNWGWGASATFLGYIHNRASVVQICSGSDGSVGYSNTFTNWTYYDGANTPHQFAGTLKYWTGTLSGVCTGSAFPETDISQATTLDSSGYTLNAKSGSVNLTTRDGAFILAPINPTSPNTNGSLQDRNGNVITLNNGAFTDTLGTKVLTITGTAPNPVSYNYVPPTPPANSQTVAVQVTYKSYTVKTNFQISGISEYGPTLNSLVDRVTYPDGTFYSFTYEQTPGFPGDVTGRLVSMSLPTGDTITDGYPGTNDDMFRDNGLILGEFANLTRTTSDGTWTYTRTNTSGGGTQTTITDPQSNQTVVSFFGGSETQRDVYQGAVSSGTLLVTTQTCYDFYSQSYPTACATAGLRILARTVIKKLPGGLQSVHAEQYTSYGLSSEVDDYDYGIGKTGSLLKKILTTYPPSGSSINAFKQIETVQDGIGKPLSTTTYNYDETAVIAPPIQPTPQHVAFSGVRGNLTSIHFPVSGLTKTFTYFDTGTIQTATDVNGAQTTNIYGAGSCGNSFPTSVNLPSVSSVGIMSKSYTWDCVGGVQTSVTDENNQTTATKYTDPFFWRPYSSIDPTNAITNYAYAGANSSESSMTFNSGNSATDVVKTSDGLGRDLLTQKRQAPGSSNFDSVQTYYDALGRPIGNSLPYSGTLGQTSPSGPAAKKTYDAVGRITEIRDAAGGVISFSYKQNDLLITLQPAPTGENLKQRQFEYDSLGRLTSVCEITAGMPAAPAGNCAQNNPIVGYWTKYTYDALGNLTAVTQNVQAASANQQTRTYTYDALSRITAETNPETGAVARTYDTDATCGTSSGNQVKLVDARGNTTCYGYDPLHRVTGITYTGPDAPVTPSKYFVFDAAVFAPGTPYAHTMANAKLRLAEAYTATCQTCTKITDEGFSYTARGEPASLYQQPPNGSNSTNTFLESDARYWENGASSYLGAVYSANSYGLDGEGRVNAAQDLQAYSSVTATSYNAAGLVTSITYGSVSGTISTSFSYDPFTNRMTQYQFKVGATSLTGPLSWNSNGTLLSHNITNGFSGANSQNCMYLYDDIARIQNASCTPPGSTTPSVWQQSFAYDAFGNISKAGSMSFQPTYTDLSGHTNNQFTSVPGCTVSYDANGNVLNDCMHTYTWNVEGRPTTIDNVNLTYDALGRMVFQNRSGSYTQILYSPSGTKLSVATFNGSGYLTEKAVFPLPGKSAAVYVNNGVGHVDPTYRHADWLGSTRFSSIPGKGGTQGTGSISIGGTCVSGCSGSISVAINGFIASISYADPATFMSVADALSTALNGSGSPVTAYSSCPPFRARSCGVYMSTVALGVSANYPFSVTASGPLVVTPSGSTLTGGADAVPAAPNFDLTYAPFGEISTQTGTVDPSFAGLRQDTVAGLYDADNREYSIQGRWPSPDPGGLSTAHPENPQSWNRYAYSLNNPLALSDHSGLDPEQCAIPGVICDAYGEPADPFVCIDFLNGFSFGQDNWGCMGAPPPPVTPFYLLPGYWNYLARLAYQQKAAQNPQPSIEPAVCARGGPSRGELFVRGVGDSVVGIAKLGIGTGVEVAGPETLPVSVYEYYSGFGNLATAGAEFYGAFSGNTERGERLGDIAKTYTSLTGMGAFALTGSYKVGSTAADYETVVTTVMSPNPIKSYQALDASSSYASLLQTAASGPACHE